MKSNHAINPLINDCLSSWNHAVNVILEGTY